MIRWFHLDFDGEQLGGDKKRAKIKTEATTGRVRVKREDKYGV